VIAEETAMFRIYLYTDQIILAHGLRLILADAGSCELKYWSADLDDFMGRFQADPPDVVLIDHALDGRLGAIRSVRELAPSCKVLLWVDSISGEQVVQAIGLGVRGLLRKTLPVERLVEGLARVNEGELWFEKALTDNLMSGRRVSLNARESELLALVAQGLNNKDIATTLGLTVGTVKVYFSHLFDKVGVQNRYELALLGLNNVPDAQLRSSHTTRTKVTIFAETRQGE
jgi:DNA-binding NarL/FixJ family response regulator